MYRPEGQPQCPVGRSQVFGAVVLALGIKFQKLLGKPTGKEGRSFILPLLADRPSNPSPSDFGILFYLPAKNSPFSCYVLFLKAPEVPPMTLNTLLKLHIGVLNY